MTIENAVITVSVATHVLLVVFIVLLVNEVSIPAIQSRKQLLQQEDQNRDVVESRNAMCQQHLLRQKEKCIWIDLP